MSLMSKMAPDNFRTFGPAFMTLFYVTGGDPWPDSLPKYNEDGSINWTVTRAISGGAKKGRNSGTISLVPWSKDKTCVHARAQEYEALTTINLKPRSIQLSHTCTTHTHRTHAHTHTRVTHTRVCTHK